jgi:hypothetical protein
MLNLVDSDPADLRYVGSGDHLNPIEREINGVAVEQRCALRQEEPADAPRLKFLLAPYPSDEMICWPVSARVGNVKNNDPGLIEPIALQ